MDWEPAERVQKNDQGEYRALIGGEWVPVAKAQKNDQGQFRVMRDVQKPQSPPTFGQLTSNAAWKGVSNLIDPILNTPTNIANLAIAGIGTPMVAAGLKEYAPDTLKTPDLVQRGLRSIGFIHPKSEPVGGWQQIADMTVQGMVGGALSPAKTIPQVVSNLAVGGTAGAVGKGTEIATGSPTAGMLAGMAVPAGVGITTAATKRVKPNNQASAGKRLKALSDDVPKMKKRLAEKSGRELVPGSLPTTAEVVMQPGISQAQRSAVNAGYAPLTERATQQNQARVAHLDNLSPGATKVLPVEAADDAGNVIAAKARADMSASKQEINAAYEGIDPSGKSRIKLPDVDGLVRSRYGDGSGGVDADIASLQNDIRNLSKRPNNPNGVLVGQTGGATGMAPYSTFQKLRSRASEIAWQAGKEGKGNKAHVAGAIKNMLDDAMDDVSGRVMRGEPLNGEYFDPHMAESFFRAKNLNIRHHEKYSTGPSLAMFRLGSDDLPVVHGAEIPPKFFGPRGSQAADVDQFLTMTGGEQSSVDALKKYAIADLSSKTNSLGYLSQAKTKNWMDSRANAVTRLFSQEEKAALMSLQHDLKRSAEAERLGIATGSNTAQNQHAAGKVVDSVINGLLGSHFGTTGSAVAGGLRSLANRNTADQIGPYLLNPDDALAAILASDKHKLYGLLGPAMERAMQRSVPQGLLYTE